MTTYLIQAVCTDSVSGTKCSPQMKIEAEGIKAAKAIYEQSHDVWRWLNSYRIDGSTYIKL
jgi:hypothetical protein